jgi:hypothetical protein
LILPVRDLAPIFAVGEKVVGVELVVAEELVERAVEVARSGLGDHVDVGPGRTPELGRGAGHHAEFFHGVHRRRSAGRVHAEEIVLDAVEREVVVLGALAVDRIKIRAGDGSIRLALGAVARTREEKDEARVVAAIHGEAGELGPGDGAAHGRLLRLQERRRVIDFDGGGDVADLQLKVDLDGVGDTDDDARLDPSLEAGLLHGELINARVEREEPVFPIGRRISMALAAGGGVRQDNSAAGDSCTEGVADRAKDG